MADKGDVDCILSKASRDPENIRLNTLVTDPDQVRVRCTLTRGGTRKPAHPSASGELTNENHDSGRSLAPEGIRHPMLNERVQTSPLWGCQVIDYHSCSVRRVLDTESVSKIPCTSSRSRTYSS